MPFIASGANATFNVPANNVIDVQCSGGFVQVEYPVGTKIFEGNVGTSRTFGPFAAGSAKLTSLKGDIYYEVDPREAQNSALDPSNVAITGGSIKGIKKLRMQESRVSLPPRLLTRQVMATPPTVTTGTTATLMTTPVSRNFQGANSSFPSNKLVDWATVLRAPISDSNVTTTATPGFGRQCSSFAFIHEGASFELQFSASSTGYLVKIDDQYVTLTPQNTGAASPFFAKYDFTGVVKRRRVDVIGFNTSPFSVNINPTDSIEPAPVRGPRVIVVGDSFTAGSGASGDTANSFTAVLSDLLGWDDVWPSGVGGTGYVNTNGGASVTFGARLAHDVLPYNPEIVWFVGSTNDDSFTAAQVSSAALAAYQTIRAGLPDATIVVSPTATGGVRRMTANKLAIMDAQKVAALQAGAIWVNPLEMPITTQFAIPTEAVYANIAANASTIQVYGTGAISGPPQVGGVIEIGTGATRERIHVKTSVFAGNDVSYKGGTYFYNITFDGTLQYAHNRLETWTQVGNSYLTGTGKVGTTTGFGNADRYVGSDGTHPSDAGHVGLAENLANGLLNALPSN